MARPQAVSEAEILEAANRVIARVGPDDFTLAAVAREVGLTRAAITFRFQSARALKVRALEQRGEAFAAMLDDLDLQPGGNGLLALAGFIGSLARTRANLISYMSINNSNLEDEDLMALEMKRGTALRDAIARAMPEGLPDEVAAVAVFSAHLTGSLIAWSASREEDGQAHLIRRTRMLLDMIGIPYDLEQPGVREAA